MIDQGPQDFKVEKVELPAESQGKCWECGQEAVLSDGLCTVCWDKHADDKQLKRSSMSFEKKEEIKRLRQSGMRREAVAAQCQISTRTVDRIFKGK